MAVPKVIVSGTIVNVDNVIYYAEDASKVRTLLLVTPNGFTPPEEVAATIENTQVGADIVAGQASLRGLATGSITTLDTVADPTSATLEQIRKGVGPGVDFEPVNSQIARRLCVADGRLINIVEQIKKCGAGTLERTFTGVHLAPQNATPANTGRTKTHNLTLWGEEGEYEEVAG